MADEPILFGILHAIMTRCPVTGRGIDTGITTDEASFESLPEVIAFLRCPACGGSHSWTRSQAWLGSDGIRVSTAREAAKSRELRACELLA